MSRAWANGIVPLLILAAQAGCVTLRPTSPELTASSEDAAVQAELPPRKAAQACLVTARALEKKGFATEAILEYEKARQSDSSLKQVAWRLAVLYDRQGN